MIDKFQKHLGAGPFGKNELIKKDGDGRVYIFSRAITIRMAKGRLITNVEVTPKLLLKMWKLL